MSKYAKNHSLSSSALKTDDDNHHAKLGEYAASLWKDKAMTDVLIVVQSKEFKAHKAVLACYSPYFKEVLVKPGFSDVHYLQLPSVTPRAFELLLEYMYTGKMKINCQELSEVYRSARRLGIQGALRKCIELLHVTPNNFQHMVYLYVTARKLNLLDSSARAFKLMVAHFERLVTTEEFLDLEKDQVVELLSSDEIGARSEVVIFLSALKWIHHNYIEREEHLIAIFKCVRFSLMNMEEILACYHPPVLPGIVTIPDIREALLNATCYIAAKSVGKESLFHELSSRPRKFLFEGEAIILWDSAMLNEKQHKNIKDTNSAIKIQACMRGYLTRKRLQENLSIMDYAATVIQSAFREHSVRKSIKTGKAPLKVETNFVGKQKGDFGQETTLPPTEQKSFPGTNVAPLQSSIFFMGACDIMDAEKDYNAIFSYEIKHDSWNFLARSPVSFNTAEIVASKDSLFIIGGCRMKKDDKFLSLKECYKYSFSNKEWKTLPFMNHFRSHHRAVEFHNRIYAVGGSDNTNNFKILSSIEMLEETSNRWVEFPNPMPEPLAAMGVAVQDSFLWIAGGITQKEGMIRLSDKVWCYNKESKKWLKQPRLPEPTAFVTLLIAKNRLLCIGGIVRSKVSNELTSIRSIFSFENRKWVNLEPMPKAFHNAVACIKEKDIYVFSGLTTQETTFMKEPFYLDSYDKRWKPLNPLPEESTGLLIASSTCMLGAKVVDSED